MCAYNNGLNVAILGSAVPALFSHVHEASRPCTRLCPRMERLSRSFGTCMKHHATKNSTSQRIARLACVCLGDYVCRYRALYVFGCRLVHSVAMCLCLSAGLTNEAPEHFPHYACPETPKDSCIKAVLFPSLPIQLFLLVLQSSLYFHGEGLVSRAAHIPLSATPLQLA
jgi:hypothetical protein